jgi:SAM-dependent methyltransferase
MITPKEWFFEWFDSPYYHMLYKHRDENEAEFFLNNLVNKLHIHSDMKIIDLACGKGRHAIYLNKKGFDVTGVDLSASSIHIAQQSKNERLRFFIQDLRYLNMDDKFDIALNLFTSFGYFQSNEDDVNALLNIHELLNEKGVLLIDFLNKERVLRNLIKQEDIQVENIRFSISRWYDEKFLYKKISFADGPMNFDFTEKVQLLDLNKFSELLNQTGFEIMETLGNYSFMPYSEKDSERLIILARKK